MLISRSDNSFFARWWLSIDKPILFLALFLTAVGFIMMFEASPYAADRIRQSGFFYIYKYPIYLSIGLAAMLAISAQRIKTLEKLAPYLFAAAFIAMVATLFSRPINGSHRWIYLLGFQLQPSEFLKPLTALLLGVLLARFKKESDPERRIKIGWSIFGIFAIIVAVLMSQTDFGMTMTFVAIFGVGIFLAGARKRYIALLFALILGGMFMAYKFVPQVNNRVERFMSKSPGDRKQVDASLRAIKGAGLLSGGTEKLRRHVPDVHTDFVFAAMVESFGILLSIGVIAASFLLSLSILAKASGVGGAAFYASASIAGYLAFQSFVNISSALGMIPPKGMTMPFISSGGSSLISSYIAIGIVLCLLRPQKEST